MGFFGSIWSGVKTGASKLGGVLKAKKGGSFLGNTLRSLRGQEMKSGNGLDLSQFLGGGGIAPAEQPYNPQYPNTSGIQSIPGVTVTSKKKFNWLYVIIPVSVLVLVLALFLTRKKR